MTHLLIYEVTFLETQAGDQIEGAGHISTISKEIVGYFFGRIIPDISGVSSWIRAHTGELSKPIHGTCSKNIGWHRKVGGRVAWPWTPVSSIGRPDPVKDLGLKDDLGLGRGGMAIDGRRNSNVAQLVPMNDRRVVGSCTFLNRCDWRIGRGPIQSRPCKLRTGAVSYDRTYDTLSAQRYHHRVGRYAHGINRDGKDTNHTTGLHGWGTISQPGINGCFTRPPCHDTCNCWFVGAWLLPPTLIQT